MKWNKNCLESFFAVSRFCNSFLGYFSQSSSPKTAPPFVALYLSAFSLTRTLADSFWITNSAPLHSGTRQAPPPVTAAPFIHHPAQSPRSLFFSFSTFRPAHCPRTRSFFLSLSLLFLLFFFYNISMARHFSGRSSHSFTGSFLSLNFPPTHHFTRSLGSLYLHTYFLFLFLSPSLPLSLSSNSCSFFRSSLDCV